MADHLELTTKNTESLVSHHRYDEVDVLRGLAAFWVVLSHYGPYWNRYLGSVPIIVPNDWGLYAVKLFFIISGFVIFMTLGRCKSISDFVILRFSRLYPTYWATLALSTAVSAIVFAKGFWLTGFAINATMLQDFLGYPRFDNVYWSLTVELAFYLMAGLLFALGFHRHTLKFVMIWLVSATLWALFVRESGHDQRDWYALLLALDYAPYFGIGIVFHDVAKQGWSISKSAIVVFAMATEFLIAGLVGLYVIFIAGLLFTLAMRGRLKFLVSKYTLWLGTISYSLYLVHRNMGYEFLSWLHSQQVGPIIAIPATVLAALALATVITYGIEKPALHHVRSRHKEWKARKIRSKALRAQN